MLDESQIIEIESLLEIDLNKVIIEIKISSWADYPYSGSAVDLDYFKSKGGKYKMYTFVPDGNSRCDGVNLYIVENAEKS